MHKKTITAVLFFLGVSASAQKGIENLIRAEKDFAAYSVAHSTKEAFEKFIDSTSIMFENGNPVLAIDYWAKRQKRPGVLNWHPQYAEIAASGDIGYTTGPWTFQNSLNDSVVARGQYSTIWHLDKNGEWKFLLDLGNEETPVPGTDTGAYRIERTNPAYKKGTLHSLLAAENKFIKAVTSFAEEAYMKYKGATFCLLNRNKLGPAWSKDLYLKAIENTPIGIHYTIQGSGIASSGDLGYVYGQTITNGKTESYFRVWRKEKEWKIALEVLRY